MRVPHSKGVANHAVPESCVAYCDVRREALTGARTDQPLSREGSIQGANAVELAEVFPGRELTHSDNDSPSNTRGGPVREVRTLGSVRGASGNGRPYRDSSIPSSRDCPALMFSHFFCRIQGILFQADTRTICPGNSYTNAHESSLRPVRPQPSGGPWASNPTHGMVSFLETSPIERGRPHIQGTFSRCSWGQPPTLPPLGLRL